MKLRFHDNSLRLRLTQPEVERLKRSGMVEDTVTFAPGQALRYSIQTAPSAHLSADFGDGFIRIRVPSAQAQNWIDSDQTGIQHSGPTLHILIEKDFQCLHQPPEAGAFPNPLAKGPEPPAPGGRKS